MHDLYIVLLPLFIVLIGFGLMLGLPVGKMIKSIGMRWLLFSALGLALPFFPVLVDHVKNHPPQSFQELVTWIGIFLVILSLLLRLLFGAGFTGRLVEHLLFSAVYDALKGFFHLVFVGIGQILGILWKLARVFAR